MLEMSGVGKRFANGTRALSGIDLKLGDGDFLVLLGPSGCGKSTLLRLIAGLDLPTEGLLLWQDGPPACGKVGYVFQDATLMPWASALANVMLPLRLRRATEAKARAREALTLVGLSDFADARPKALSGGMRMRVSIARALVTEPHLLLMDEPFAALDEFTRHRLQDELLGITAAIGCTTVFVTHSIYEAAALASRVVLMSARPGRIAQELRGAPVAERGRAGDGFARRAARLAEAVQALHVPA